MSFNKIKYVLFILMCMCVTPVITHAECDYQRQAELSRLASNVQFNYTSEISNGLRFNLYITNLTNDLYIVDDYGNVFSGSGEKQFTYSSNTISGFRNGAKVSFKFFSNDVNCKGGFITTKYVNFPYFNSYSSLDECKQYPNFKYCQMWTNTSNLSLDQFQNEIQQYRRDSEKTNKVIKTNYLDLIIDMLNQSYIKVFIVFLMIVIIISVLFIKWQNKKYQRR